MPVSRSRENSMSGQYHDESGGGVTPPRKDGSTPELSPTGDREESLEPASWKVNPRGSRLGDDCLPGTERLDGLDKLWLLHPHALLAIAGCLAVFSVDSPFFLASVFLWMIFSVGWRPGDNRSVAERVNDRLSPPSSALRGGFRAIGLAALAATVTGMLGPPGLAFYVLNASWVLLTAMAVSRGSRTDPQTGWMAGATSMAAACTFFGLPLALIPGIPWPVAILPFMSAGAAWQTWNYLSSRGRKRTRSAMKAVGFASLATILYLPAAVLTGFSLFEVMCHFSVVAASVLIPFKECLGRMSLPSAPPLQCLPDGGSDDGAGE
jgi:hypothetical protein